jgi:hypothetical protein
MTFLIYIHYIQYVFSSNNKGTGTRDYNGVKVVRFDRPWLGESSAGVHNFVNCPFNFILN